MKNKKRKKKSCEEKKNKLKMSTKSHLSQKFIELKLVEDEWVSFWKNLWKTPSKTISQDQLLKL